MHILVLYIIEGGVAVAIQYTVCFMYSEETRYIESNFYLSLKYAVLCNVLTTVLTSRRSTYQTF